MFKLVLLCFLSLLPLAVNGQRTPKWLTQPPVPDQKWVYSIGISDIGLEPSAARRQALSRAHTLAALSTTSKITATIVSSSADGDLTGLELDPRSSYAIDIVAPSCATSETVVQGSYTAESVVYILIRVPRNACGSSAARNVTARYFRDDSRGFSSMSFTLDSPADSVLIYADELDNTVEYRSGWPELAETEKTQSAGALRSETPAWMSKMPPPQLDMFYSFDVASHTGRFAPFLSYVQAFILASGDAAAKAGAAQIISEDPYVYQGRTLFATQTTISVHRATGLYPVRIQISRSSQIYQTAVQMGVRIPAGTGS